MAEFVDLFDREDESPIGDPYETIRDGGVELFSSDVRATTVAGNDVSAIKTSERTFGANQRAGVIATGLQTGDFRGVACRCTANGNCYDFRYDGNAVSQALYSCVDNVQEQLAVYNTEAIVDGDYIEIEAIDDTIKVYRDGLEILSVTNTDHSSGQPGIYARWGNTNASRITEFRADDISPASIDTITTPIVSGSTGNSLDVLGFTGDITSLTLKAGTFTMAVPNLSGAGNNYTFNGPDITGITSDTPGVPISSAYHNALVAEATDGTDTDDIAATLALPAGWDMVETSATPNMDVGSVYHGWTGPLLQHSQVIYPAAPNRVIHPNGELETDEPFDYVFFDLSDGQYKSLSVIGGQGEIDVLDSAVGTDGLSFSGAAPVNDAALGEDAINLAAATEVDDIASASDVIKIGKYLNINTVRMVDIQVIN